MKDIKKVIIELNNGKKGSMELYHHINMIHTKDFDGTETWESFNNLSSEESAKNKIKKYYLINNTGLINRGLWILTSVFIFAFCIGVSNIVREVFFTWQFLVPWSALLIIGLIFMGVGISDNPELFCGLESYNKRQMMKRRK